MGHEQTDLYHEQSNWIDLTHTCHEHAVKQSLLIVVLMTGSKERKSDKISPKKGKIQYGLRENRKLERGGGEREGGEGERKRERGGWGRGRKKDRERRGEGGRRERERVVAAKCMYLKDILNRMYTWSSFLLPFCLRSFHISDIRKTLCSFGASS